MYKSEAWYRYLQHSFWCVHVLDMVKHFVWLYEANQSLCLFDQPYIFLNSGALIVYRWVPFEIQCQSSSSVSCLDMGNRILVLVLALHTSDKLVLSRFFGVFYGIAVCTKFMSNIFVLWNAQNHTLEFFKFHIFGNQWRRRNLVKIFWNFV